MLYDDHSPLHFNVEYGEYKISVEIKSGIVQGRFPRRALRAVMEWYDINQDILLEDWKLAEKHESLKKIPPLE